MHGLMAPTLPTLGLECAYSAAILPAAAQPPHRTMSHAPVSHATCHAPRATCLLRQLEACAWVRHGREGQGRVDDGRLRVDEGGVLQRHNLQSGLPVAMTSNILSDEWWCLRCTGGGGGGKRVGWGGGRQRRKLLGVSCVCMGSHPSERSRAYTKTGLAHSE